MYRPGFWTIVAFVLVLALFALAMGAVGEPGDPPASGDWVLTNNVEYDSKTGHVHGNLRLLPLSKLEITDSVLIIDDSIEVSSDATLLITNSTIKFNCSLSKTNRLLVNNAGVCTIEDTDDNRETEGDGSLITSLNDIQYNISLMKAAVFNLRNSEVSKCGRPFDDLVLEEGFLVRSDRASIIGSVIRDCYYGLIIDQADGVTVDNTTIEDCYVGIYMIGVGQTTIRRTDVRDCTEYGIDLHGLAGNTLLDSMMISGNGVADFKATFVAGFNNKALNCSFGPGDPVALFLEDAKDFLFHKIDIDQCDLGVYAAKGDVEFSRMRITDCPRGIELVDGAMVRFRDLNLADTTVEMEALTNTNITVDTNITWERVTANLTCDLVARGGTTILIEDSVLNFRGSPTGATGIRALRSGTFSIMHSRLDSPENHTLLCQLLDGSRSIFSDAQFSNMGDDSGGVVRTGMWIGGTGTIEDVTISDSIAGLVIGKSQTNMVNITIVDCLTGIVTDGDLGRGGVSIRGLVLRGCDVAIKSVNEGSVSVINGRFQLKGEGFNITTSSVYIKDSWVSDPGPGMSTATLREMATLDIVNSSTSRVFDIGPNFNVVNILWYLNLTLRYLSDGSPLSDATVTVKEASGAISILNEPAGADGVIQEMELRERIYNPDLLIQTPHTVTVTKGNLVDSFKVTVEASIDHLFYMDNYPPVLVVDAPEDGSVHFVPNITFEGEAYDAVVTATEGLAAIRYRVDGGPWTPIDLPEGTEWSFDVTMEDGFHSVEIQVRDRIGNINSTTITLDVDTMAPRLTVMTPLDNIVVNYTEVTVHGLADPNATVTVDEVVVELDEDGEFNRTLTLAQGGNVIVIVAEDSVGKKTVATRNVTVDTVAPEVKFDQEDLRTSQLTFTLSGTKEANATLYINGFRPEFFGVTEFEVQVDLPVEGINDVDVWSEDLAGNNWTTTLLINRDTEPPELVVGQLPEFTNKATVTVQGSVNDPDATVTVNGVEVTLSGTTYAHTVTLVEGQNTITVETVDSAGNAAEPVVMVVTLSTTPPKLVIDTPKFVETVEFSQEITGETDPLLPVSVKVVLGPYSKTYSVDAEANGSFSVEVDLPQIGNHSVTVTVTNEAGNKASEQLYFVRNRQEGDGPPKPKEDTWLEKNWAYVILVAAIIASAGIWMITLSAGKRRREQMAAHATAVPGPEEGPEEWDEEEEAEVEGEETGADRDDEAGRVEDGTTVDEVSDEALEDEEADQEEERD